ncbi:MAG: GxxExxY protein [Candidatus Sumerlaeia bacterium]|nr:GxxExxY protein [Candidatus Sumerlaeia bacterium]
MDQTLKHAELTQKIIGASFDVINVMGSGFVESVYEKCLYHALREFQINVVCQQPIKVFFRKHVVGEFIADLLVEDVVIVELKAVKSLQPEHKAQLINYLKASQLEVGLLINFGNQRLEFKRFNRNGFVEDSSDHP